MDQLGKRHVDACAIVTRLPKHSARWHPATMLDLVDFVDWVPPEDDSDKADWTNVEIPEAVPQRKVTRGTVQNWEKFRERQQKRAISKRSNAERIRKGLPREEDVPPCIVCGTHYVR